MENANVLRRDEAQARARRISNVTYDVALSLHDDADRDTFGSTTVVTFDLDDPATDTFIDITAPTLLRATLNGADLSADAFNGDRLTLPAAHLAASNTLEVVVDAAYMTTGSGLTREIDPTDNLHYVHTQFEPFDAHRVFACFDQPDLKAPLRLSVTAPESWVVRSNALHDSVTGGGDGTKRWTFPPLAPMSTYLAAVVAGPFADFHEQHGDIDMGLYCRQSLAQYIDVDDIFLVTKQGFDYFGKLFDYPYPFGKYDQLFVPGFSAGAMENPGCVTFNENYIFRSAITESMRESRANVILHEMAHMWFGDLVTMKWWDDLWLNESFATYMASRAAAEAARFTQAWSRFASGLKAGAYAQDQLPSTHPISADMTDTEVLRLNFDGITYNKGASVMRQLAAWVGQDAFDEGLRDYFRRYEYANADLNDFLGALEKPSGRSLQGWAEEWLQTAGVNTLVADIETDDQGNIASFAIVQSAVDEHPTIRSHRARIGLYRVEDSAAAGAAGGALVPARSVELDIVGPRTEVTELVGQPSPDLVIVNEDDLTYTKIRLDERSMRTVTERLGALDSPLSRSLIWSSAWDMVRDAEMSGREFARMVIRHIAGEELTAGDRLFGLAASAIDSYVEPRFRAAARVPLSGYARDRMLAAAPGSDEQRTWAQNWISEAITDEDAKSVAALLDGEWEVPGLAVDIDLRWLLVSLLVTRLGGDPARADAERDRDPTDMGRRMALNVTAGQPNLAAKEAAWEQSLRDTELSLTDRAYLANGIWRLEQDEICEPFIERYFAELPGIWERFDTDEATTLTAGLAPRGVVRQDVIDRIHRALDELDLGPIAQRILVERADALRRALKCQQFDAANGPTD